MKDRVHFGPSKRAFPLRTLEICLGAIAFIYALLEPLPFTPLQTSTTIQQQHDVIEMSPKELSQDVIHASVTPTGNSVVISKQQEVTGLQMIHPWLPTITGKQVKAVLREALILLILNNVGVPLIGRFRTQVLVGARWLIPIQRRFSRFVLSRKVFVSLRRFLPSTKVLRLVQIHFRRVWKVLLTWYSKTSASKIINRCKKYLHTFLHDHDHHDDHHSNDHDKESSSHKKEHKQQSHKSPKQKAATH